MRDQKRLAEWGRQPGTTVGMLSQVQTQCLEDAWCWHRDTFALMYTHPETQQSRLHKQQPQFCWFSASVLRVCAGVIALLSLNGYKFS